MGSSEQGIIYYLLKDTCKAISGKLGYPYYFSDTVGKAEAFQAWRNGDHKFIVATSALGAGIDIPGVRVIIHINKPGKLIDFVHESGRAGRDGKPSKSIVILNKINSTPRPWKFLLVLTARLLSSRNTWETKGVGRISLDGTWTVTMQHVIHFWQFSA
ncbi:hypothetical protein RUND412_006082 [Rhizina undulata]